MDPISNLIVQIKNASDAGKDMVTVPYSRMKEEILTVLEKEGFVKSVAKRGKKIHKSIDVGLMYDTYGPRVKGVKRMSHLSKRMYGGVKDLRPVKQGHGVLVITTPKGILTDAEARRQKVGGELLFKIW
ncbi:30S ribosomal protein S8 [Candidatus Parcubacteria bacterium]|nr:30S ribosomal protein S8 [Candidatus Parcubacteria bacterium]